MAQSRVVRNSGSPPGSKLLLAPASWFHNCKHQSSVVLSSPIWYCECYSEYLWHLVVVSCKNLKRCYCVRWLTHFAPQKAFLRSCCKKVTQSYRLPNAGKRRVQQVEPLTSWCHWSISPLERFICFTNMFLLHFVMHNRPYERTTLSLPFLYVMVGYNWECIRWMKVKGEMLVCNNWYWV